MPSRTERSGRTIAGRPSPARRFVLACRSNRVRQFVLACRSNRTRQAVLACRSSYARRAVLVLAVAAMTVLAGCGGGQLAGSGGSVGVSAGGAQDVTAFRKNVHEGYVPQPTDMAYEGLYHDYYFDTGAADCDRTFCPSYSRAVSRDPLSNETEYFATVGLNSGISLANFSREPLDLVVVVDASGSMDESFGDYYYDNGTRAEGGGDTTKMQAAREALTAMTDHLGPDDRLGIVAYDRSARVVQPVTSVAELGEGDIRRRVEDIEAGGSTNLDAGMATATEMLRPYRDTDDRATRIIYLTDAMPNVGDTSSGGLEDRLRENADRGVYSTFVGVGVDFNTELVESINEVEGGNYYSVHSTEAFRERMDEGFSYMVTPLAFNLTVTVDSEAVAVERVYGSPDAEATTGRVLHVNTLFPSRREGNRTEGSVILVQFRRQGGADLPATVTLTATYRPADAEERRRVTRQIRLGEHEANYYETTGVRKAVLLARYADLMRNWAAYQRAQAGDGTPETPAAGIEGRDLGQWEQRSVDLAVAPIYRERIEAFESHFVAEMRALGDDRLAQDRRILATLSEHPRNATATAGGG